MAGQPRLFEEPAITLHATFLWSESTGWRLTLAHRSLGDAEWLVEHLSTYDNLTLLEALDVFESEVERRRGF